MASSRTFLFPVGFFAVLGIVVALEYAAVTMDLGDMKAAVVVTSGDCTFNDPNDKTSGKRSATYRIPEGETEVSEAEVNEACVYAKALLEIEVLDCMLNRQNICENYFDGKFTPAGVQSASGLESEKTSRSTDTTGCTMTILAGSEKIFSCAWTASDQSAPSSTPVASTPTVAPIESTSGDCSIDPACRGWNVDYDHDAPEGDGGWGPGRRAGEDISRYNNNCRFMYRGYGRFPGNAENEAQAAIKKAANDCWQSERQKCLDKGHFPQLTNGTTPGVYNMEGFEFFYSTWGIDSPFTWVCTDSPVTLCDRSGGPTCGGFCAGSNVCQYEKSNNRCRCGPPQNTPTETPTLATPPVTDEAPTILTPPPTRFFGN